MHKEGKKKKIGILRKVKEYYNNEKGQKIKDKKIRELIQKI